VNGEPRARWRIDDVLDRIRLDELLDQLAGPSERSGPGRRRWHCPAPNHEDHRASVSMHTDRRGHERWRCWSGDHRGDAIDLVVTVRGGTRSEAIAWLATRAGMIPDRPLPPITPKPRPAPPAASMDPAVERYVRVCAAVLAGPQGREVRDWLAGRGFSEATIRGNLVGADPGRQLMRRRRGLPYGKVPAATFPALGPTGQVTFVQARYLDPVAAGRKYDNPAASLAPHPRTAFPALPVPARWPWLMVCEGMPDALTAAQAGYRSVALLGDRTPDDTVAARIAGHAEAHRLEVVVMCDANSSGRAAGTHLAGLLAAEQLDATLVEPPADVHDADGAPVVDLNAWALADPDWCEQLNDALDPALTVPTPTRSPVAVSRPGPEICFDDD
jgi:hypothetical protein